jgi:hypothetical protein
VSEHATREDLREALRDMREVLRDGFEGINDRLDELNGRTRKSEEAIGRHDERMLALERVKTAPGTVNDLGMVRGDWKMLAGVGVIIGGAIAGLIQGAVKIYSAISVVGK